MSGLALSRRLELTGSHPELKRMCLPECRRSADLRGTGYLFHYAGRRGVPCTCPIRLLYFFIASLSPTCDCRADGSNQTGRNSPENRHFFLKLRGSI